MVHVNAANVSDSDASRKDLKTLTQCPSDQWAQNGRTFKVQIQTLSVNLAKPCLGYTLSQNNRKLYFRTIHSKMKFCHHYLQVVPNLSNFFLLLNKKVFYKCVLPNGCWSPLTSIVWRGKKIQSVVSGYQKPFVYQHSSKTFCVQ